MLVQRICVAAVAALAFSPLTAVSQVQARRPIEPRDEVRSRGASSSRLTDQRTPFALARVNHGRAWFFR